MKKAFTTDAKRMPNLPNGATHRSYYRDRFGRIQTEDTGGPTGSTNSSQCGQPTLGPDDSVKPCIKPANHVGEFCDSGVR